MFIKGTQISFAMQKSFDIAELYFMLQQNIFATLALRSIGLSSYSPVISPILVPSDDFIHLRLYTPGQREDRWSMENAINSWITANTISENLIQSLFV
jgi:hypothetical protein